VSANVNFSQTRYPLPARPVVLRILPAAYESIVSSNAVQLQHQIRAMLRDGHIRERGGSRRLPYDGACAFRARNTQAEHAASTCAGVISAVVVEVILSEARVAASC
jgi:hypothetical protein